MAMRKKKAGQVIFSLVRSIRRVVPCGLACAVTTCASGVETAGAARRVGPYAAYGSFAEMAGASNTPVPKAEAVTSGPLAHWFGYYDKAESDAAGRYLLAMEVGFEHRLPEPGEAVRIGMVDLRDGNRWIALGESRAWCWQQGCMLQWRPGSTNEVVWNDREGGRFVCRILDVRTRKVRTLPKAAGHISPDGRWAVCEDFSRARDFRPGYGYAGVPDAYAGQNAPPEIGVWRMDMETGETRLIVSLADLVNVPYAGQSPSDKHYVNHLQWSPDGARFLLYDRWSRPGGGWSTRVFTAGADGQDLRLLVAAGVVSHYMWRDPAHVLIWWKDGYHLFKDDGSGTPVASLWKATDGHQSYIPGTKNEWLVADTYGRRLYLHHLPTGTFVLLGAFPQDKAYAGEWRCDLHPRVSADGEWVYFDSPHGGNGRQIYRVNIGGIVRLRPETPVKSAGAALPEKPDTGNPRVELPARGGEDMAGFEEVAFLSKEKSLAAWGGGGEVPKIYPQEWLPALFRRTLSLGAPLGAAEELTWRFTGPQAGLDVQVSARKLTVTQRFYDSPGYHEVTGKAGRNPEWDTSKTWELTGDVREVSVAIDQGMNLRVALNGRSVFERRWMLDLTRHQLAVKAERPIAVRFLKPAAGQATVSVDPAARRQRMSGFGGITTPTAYAQLSAEGKRRWWRLLCEYNLLIQREYPIGTQLHETMDNWDVLDDAVSHYYGSNFPNGEICDFTYNRLIYSLGGKVWFEFWWLPKWVGDDVENYARAMVNYCQTSVKKAGRAPDVVGIQNEHAHPAERLHAMVKTLRHRLDEAGFKGVAIHSSNLARLHAGIEEIKKYKTDPDVWRLIDYSASNIYDYQKHFFAIDGFDGLLKEWAEVTAPKPFLAVEICMTEGPIQLPSYRPAFIMAQLYHKLLTITDASAVAYCWTLLNVVEPSFGWSRTLAVVDGANGFVPSTVHQLRTFGAYSRRVKENMTRVEAVSDRPDLLACAFAGEGGGATLVALNRSQVPLNLRVNWPGTAFREVERVSLYEVNRVEPYGDGNVIVGPGEIVTLTNVALNALPVSFFEDNGL